MVGRWGRWQKCGWKVGRWERWKSGSWKVQKVGKVGKGLLEGVKGADGGKG